MTTTFEDLNGNAVLDVDAIRRCSAESFESNMPFPEVVRQLTQAGVERYDTDLMRMRKTFYGRGGGTHVELFPEFTPVEIPEEFSANRVAEAVAASQQRRIGYREFLTEIMHAGTAAYHVFLTGRKVMYVGRKGETHVEHFPPAA